MRLRAGGGGGACPQSPQETVAAHLIACARPSCYATGDNFVSMPCSFLWTHHACSGLNSEGLLQSFRLSGYSSCLSIASFSPSSFAIAMLRYAISIYFLGCSFVYDQP